MTSKQNGPALFSNTQMPVSKLSEEISQHQAVVEINV
jgi:hypothetical protein